MARSDSDLDDSLHDPDFLPDEEASSGDSNKTVTLMTSDGTQDEADTCLASTTQKSETAKGGKKKRIRSDTEKKWRNAEKYPLRSPCKCKERCLEKITEERRTEIHRQFWDMGYDERRTYLRGHIRVLPKSRSRPRSGEGERNFSRYYMLPDSDAQDMFVCKSFFLKTFGYTSDKIITTSLASASRDVLIPPPDKRGKHDPTHKLTADTRKMLEDHIRSHNPAISHYRREHAPNRLYLPAELTISGMHKDFTEKHSSVSVCYETYRKIVTEMNISFAKLGEEECELCLLYNEHKHYSDSENPNSCSQCADWREHNERARLARKHYISDKDIQCNASSVFLSTDMQKIVMLPAMPGVKSAVFTRRLVAFHQTFAPLGSRSKRLRATGVIWHEALAGRNAEDVASAFMKFIQCDKFRDCKQFVIWCDNCSGQNKNWTLYTTLCFAVNHPGGPDHITLRYLERGHTFISADSFHASVEKTMKQKGNVYDFADFSDSISKNGWPLEMQSTDFVDWPNGSSSAKFTHKPILRDVCEVSSSYAWRALLFCIDNYG